MRAKLLVVGVAFVAGLFSHSALTAQSSSRRAIQPQNIPYLGLPYSPAILESNTLYLAGQLGRDPKSNQIVPGGIEAETRQALTNIRVVLREAGMDFTNVASTTAYIVDFKEFDAFNKVYREFFTKD